MQYENINKCKASKFIPNLGEISSYYNARKNVPLITNIPRLIGIIRIYFETLLYYKDNSPRKFIVNIKGRLYEAKINGHNEAGQPISLDLEDVSDKLIKDVIYDLTKIINLEIFDQAIQLLNSILLTINISVKHKISIINGENMVIENMWYTLVRQLPEKLALDTILIRKNIIFQIVKSPQKYFPDLSNIDQNISALHNAYELYIKTLLRVHISNNHYIDVITTLYNELEDIKKNVPYEYINVKRWVTFLLTQLVLNNNLFQIERKDQIREIIDEYSDYIDKEKSKIIYDGLDFNPANFELDKLSVELVEPNLSKENLNNIKTVISFVLPFKIEVSFTSYELEDNTKIEFIKMSNLFEDPIFSFLDSRELRTYP